MVITLEQYHEMNQRLLRNAAKAQTNLSQVKPAQPEWSDAPNKTEAAFWAYLKTAYRGWDIEFNTVALKLAKKTWYHPDFVLFHTEQLPLIFEVKGFFRDDAAVKLKVAASRFRWAQFYLARRIKGTWKIDPVNP